MDLALAAYEKLVALLRAAVPSPVRALALAAADDLARPLDPVMVLGYPGGRVPLDGGLADASPSLGEVRRSGGSRYVTSPIVPGNSGGPILDARGMVVGLAARTLGDSSLGTAIRSSHVLELLHRHQGGE